MFKNKKKIFFQLNVLSWLSFVFCFWFFFFQSGFWTTKQSWAMRIQIHPYNAYISCWTKELHYFFQLKSTSHFSEFLFFLASPFLLMWGSFFSVYTSAYRNWNAFWCRVIHSGCTCFSLINLKISELKLWVWEENERHWRKKIFNYKRNKRTKKPPQTLSVKQMVRNILKKKGGKRLLVSRSIYKLISQQEQRLIFEKGCNNQNLITDREMSAWIY